MDVEQGTSSNEISAIVNPIEIVSEDGQITLHQLTPPDAAELFAVLNESRDHLSQVHSGVQDDTADKYPTEQSMLYSITHPKDPRRMRFGIRNTENKMVGSINLQPQDDPTEAEVGYWIGQPHGGQGYTRKAVETLVPYALSSLGYDRIKAVVLEGNTPSIKVLERAGFTKSDQDPNHPKEIVFYKSKE